MNFQMGIIKVEIKIPELVQALESFKENRVHALEVLSHEIRNGVGDFVNALLQTEMDLYLGQAEQSANKRNGIREREYAIKGVGLIRIRMPTDRKRSFQSVVVPPHEQIDPRLKEDIAVLHLAGLSNRVMAMVSKRILGVEVSTDTVTKSLDVIEDRALEWLERPLEKKYWALFIDGTNFRIQRRGSTEKEPSLVVLGIDAESRMSILTIQPGQKDNAESWREAFKDLIKRGLDPDAVQIGVMDGLPGLENAFRESFTKAVTGRCWVHSLRNAMAKVPERLREPFKKLAHQVMYANSEASARAAFGALKAEMKTDAERSVRVIEKDLDSLLVHYKFEKRFWRTLRTTNPIERVNKELKRPTKSMETLGERTLEVLVAFTAMRLEYHWIRVPVDSSHLEKLGSSKRNKIEETVLQLIH
ncbi:MAG: IS256 family transposase [Bdellovibrionales bacterium]|nr:IS256 family transposase [Bdellovibrionales bacterium]